ncbi:MAG: metallophosphoesterase [Saonia sp.]
MTRYIHIVIIFIFSSRLCSQHVPISREAKKDDVIAQDSLVLSKPVIKKLSFDGLDGPYIVNDTLFRVNSQNQFIIEKHFDTDSLIIQASNTYADYFHLSLKSDYKVPKSSYDLPDKMIVISDVEGKFNAFSSFLMTNKVIDENHNWIFGDGHLVLLGDFVDRGRNVTQVLWLIYKLEYQSLAEGGQVHFILGNHEVLNFQGDHRYNNGKYIKVAQEISREENKIKAVKFMFSDRSELGKWLATKNVIEKIGDYLFVHAGLSPEILSYGLTLDEINIKVRSRFKKDSSNKDKVIDFLYGAKGPFWYRGLVMNRLNYKKIKAVDLERILSHYNSKKIVIGHTIVKDISTGYSGKVIMVDVPHGHDKFTGKTKGILIENGKEFSIDDLGNKISLGK